MGCDPFFYMNWNKRYAIDIHSTGYPWHPDDDYIFNHPDAQKPVMMDPKKIVSNYLPMHSTLEDFEYGGKTLPEMWKETAKRLIPSISPSFSEEIKKNGVKKPIMVYHSTDSLLLGKHPGVVLDGHHRLLDTIRQGVQEVPVSFIPAPKKDIEDRLDVEL